MSNNIDNQDQNLEPTQNLDFLSGTTDNTEPQTTQPTNNSDPAGLENGSGATSPQPPVSDNASSAEPTKTSSSLSPEDVAKIVEAATKSAVQQQPVSQSQQPQLSKQEIDKMLKRYIVAPDKVAKLLNPDVPEEERVSVLQEMIDGAATHAVARAELIMQNLVTNFYQHDFLPLQSVVAAERSQKEVETFFSEYPGLEAHKDVVSMVSSQLLASGKVNKMSKSEFKKAVVDGVSSIVKKGFPDFDAKKKAEGISQTENVTNASVTQSAVPQATQRGIPTGSSIRQPNNGFRTGSSRPGSELFEGVIE